MHNPEITAANMEFLYCALEKDHQNVIPEFMPRKQTVHSPLSIHTLNAFHLNSKFEKL